MHAAFLAVRLVDLAVFDWIGLAVLPRVVDQLVHVVSEQLRLGFIAEQLDAGRIRERAITVEVDAVDALAGGVEERADQLLAVFEFVGWLLARSHRRASIRCAIITSATLTKPAVFRISDAVDVGVVPDAQHVEVTLIDSMRSSRY